jgi:class 3 adenylate cyclase
MSRQGQHERGVRQLGFSNSQGTPDAPSGVVTFLFTDVEGSTRRWEADPDAMRAALATHDELLWETVAAHRGWLFKHTGDGVCAAFASPKAAVDAAVDAQRGLELPVRMGIATGEAELRGDDYFGAVLNRAARIMSAGHGGADPARWSHRGPSHRCGSDGAGCTPTSRYRQTR